MSTKPKPTTMPKESRFKTEDRGIGKTFHGTQRGRSSLPDGEALIGVNIKISPDENQAAIAQADRESKHTGFPVSRSAVIRKALVAYLSQKGGK